VALVIARVACRMVAAGALLALLALATPRVHAQPAVQATEARIKAAFLFKFGDYVEWPPETFAAPEAPFTIGVIDAAEFARELATITLDRRLNGHRVEIRTLRADEPLHGLQVLFVGRAGARDLPALLARLPRAATLTVTESDDGWHGGSVINFVLVGDKVRFDVSLPAADSAGLRISSRLLAVARAVKERA
jgi:hypothetical protein